ncbi:MAG: signal peptidase I [Kiritimatiellae bacterium]|nr:signal peptidase I [Kiritimatiellia bacterium]
MTKTLKDYAKEWLDTLVVAISVAMAFRAYFYEPFNIPTGSMQPTLYGNHYQACENPGVWQKTPLKWFNWITSGREYKELIAPFDGEVVAEKRADDGRRVMYVTSALQRSKELKMPEDTLSYIENNFKSEGLNLQFIPHDRLGRIMVLHYMNDEGTIGNPFRVKKGRKVFAGYDTTGDFVFVNRWKWHFRLPSRSDVMVFSTTGIDGLMQGTHYIKRVTALPNETVEITKNGDVIIDGKVMPPLKPMIGARGEKTPMPNPGRSSMGYAMSKPVTLGEKEYFTCGDNSDNSLDSRYWGAVPEEKVTGNASCVFWPILNPRWGTIK